VVTGTRAEYGLFRALLDELDAHGAFDTRLLVTGAHLSPDHGLTIREIEADDRAIAARVELPLTDDSEVGTARASAAALEGAAQAIANFRPELLVVLGDRYETFAATAAAYLLRVPVAQLEGGELTLGALDDNLRHAITKLSTLHFTADEVCRQRVIQMGEDPARVFAVGALGVDNTVRLPLLSSAELESELGFPTGEPFAVVTFHPVTTAPDNGLSEARELLAALDRLDWLRVLLTSVNADSGSRSIRNLEDTWVEAHAGRAWAYDSLGSLRYLSAVAAAAVVIGNSSSGIIEAPSLGTCSVDVGTRQTGRARAASVITTPADRESIVEAVNRALDLAQSGGLANIQNPYGDGHAAERIVHELHCWLAEPRDIRKSFFDFECPLVRAASEAG
jgi:UDP-hydrolysing UDP-N-acetyl-D-glucosamine 2-epimerase